MPEPRIDRLPPYSPEAEQGVLGCLLLDPAFSIATCIARLRSGSQVFYDLRHQTIYETIVELTDDNIPIDTINVQERLKLWDKLEQVGGLSYIMHLPDTVMSAQNLESYLTILLEKYSLRKMIHICTDIVGRLYEPGAEAALLLDEAEKEVLKASEERVVITEKTIRSLVIQAINNIEVYQQKSGQLIGIGTGLHDLDKMTGGFRGGEMIVLAGRPSTGKTSLAMNIAEHVTLNLQLPVGVFSLEMSAEALVERMICSRGRVNLKNMREGFLAERDFPKITSAAGKIQTAPLYIDDQGGQSILQIRSKARRWVQQYNIKLVIIDYLQLANATGTKRIENRQQEVSEISIGIKNMAKELCIPVIALSQMNREFEREKNRKPRLADLRESGSLEQDADLVGMLYKPPSDDDDDNFEEEALPVNLYLAKQRNGPTGIINLTFLKSYTRFESAASVSENDVP